MKQLQTETLTDKRLTHFWTIADILQKRYGEPTSCEAGLPWEPFAIAWRHKRHKLYIEAYTFEARETVTATLAIDRKPVEQRCLRLLLEASGTHNLRRVFRWLATSDFLPMWDFLEAHFKPANGKRLEAISHDDIIPEGDT